MKRASSFPHRTFPGIVSELNDYEWFLPFVDSPFDIWRNFFSNSILPQFFGELEIENDKTKKKWRVWSFLKIKRNVFLNENFRASSKIKKYISDGSSDVFLKIEKNLFLSKNAHNIRNTISLKMWESIDEKERDENFIYIFEIVVNKSKESIVENRNLTREVLL